MISDRLAHLQAKLDSMSNIPAETRADLADLIANLKAEVEALPEATEASGESTTPDSIKDSVDDLTASVQQFEASHPQLTSLVQRLANVLSNMGI